MIVCDLIEDHDNYGTFYCFKCREDSLRWSPHFDTKEEAFEWLMSDSEVKYSGKILTR